MELEQQLISGLVILGKNLMEKIIGKNLVIKIEKPGGIAQYIKKLNVKVCDSEHRLSYVAAINTALVNEAEKLIIINNNEHLNEEKIERRIKMALEDDLVKQVRKILREKYDYELGPIIIYDPELRPVSIIDIEY